MSDDLVAKGGGAHLDELHYRGAIAHGHGARSQCAATHARAGAPISVAQEAIWNNVYARVWSFLREVRTLDGGAKLTKAQLDVNEL